MNLLPLSNAERQARYRARHGRINLPVHFATPARLRRLSRLLRIPQRRVLETALARLEGEVKSRMSPDVLQRYEAQS